jgi:hypothetical protein
LGVEEATKELKISIDGMLETINKKQKQNKKEKERLLLLLLLLVLLLVLLVLLFFEMLRREHEEEDLQEDSEGIKLREIVINKEDADAADDGERRRERLFDSPHGEKEESKEKDKEGRRGQGEGEGEEGRGWWRGQLGFAYLVLSVAIVAVSSAAVVLSMLSEVPPLMRASWRQQVTHFFFSLFLSFSRS